MRPTECPASLLVGQLGQGWAGGVCREIARGTSGMPGLALCACQAAKRIGHTALVGPPWLGTPYGDMPNGPASQVASHSRLGHAIGEHLLSASATHVSFLVCSLWQWVQRVGAAEAGQAFLSWHALDAMSKVSHW